MKILIIILFTIASGFYASGKCASSGMDFWPKSKVIKQNSIFIIDGIYESQEIIKGLGAKHKVYLKGKGEKIELKVSQIYKGDLSVTQAVLKPTELLKAGVVYELKIDNLPKGSDLLVRYNEDYEKEKIVWEVEEGTDTAVPEWGKKPELKSKEYEELGCGPVSYLKFAYSVVDDSEVIFKTSVKNLTTGRSSTFFITSYEDLILVGHGMCTGAFTFDDGKKFEVHISIMDASGNKSYWSNVSHTIEKPK